MIIDNCESEVTQLCPTLCDPMDCSPPGSSVHGIFQARVLEWIAISFARGSSWPRDRTRVSCTAGRCFTVWATRESHKGSIEIWTRITGFRVQSANHYTMEPTTSISLSPLFLVGWGGGAGKNTGVGCHSFHQEIFQTQGLNLGLPHFRQTLYRLSHQGSLNKCSIYYIYSYFLTPWLYNYWKDEKDFFFEDFWIG